MFLGTGGGRHVMASQQRYTGGILIKINGQQLHLDPGPGALVRALEYGLNPMDTSAFLVSHMHIDHCNDINLLINAVTQGGMEKKGTLIASESLIPGQSMLHGRFAGWLEKRKHMMAGQTTRLGDVSIEALPTKHTDELGIGFKITTNKVVLSYTSDTDYRARIADTYAGSDVLILNCQQPELEPLGHHLSSGKVVEILERVKPKLAILTHFGEGMLNANPLYEAREIQRRTGIQTVAAHDGMILHPQSYSAASAQSRIGSF